MSNRVEQPSNFTYSEGGPFFVIEGERTTPGPYPYGGRPCTTKLEAIISALLWKRDTKKECRIYDALGNCLYDTRTANETLEIAA